MNAQLEKLKQILIVITVFYLKVLKCSHLDK